MLFDSIKYHLAIMSRRKTTALGFLILLGAVSINFLINMLQNAQIGYITNMYDPMKLLTLSTWSKTSFFLFLLLPFLFILPTALSYLHDRNTGIKTYIQTRCGRQAYWYGQLIAVFILTFIIFSIPFLIELGLSCVCFDLRSNGDPSNFDYISYMLNGDSFFMDSLFFRHRILHSLFYILIFAIIAGTLATFNYAISTLPFMKFKIFTFFPVYLLFYIITFLEKYLQFDFDTYYFFILKSFEYDGRFNYIVYGFFLLLLIIISLGIITIQARKDNNL